MSLNAHVKGFALESLWTWGNVGFPWSHCCQPGRDGRADAALITLKWARLYGKFCSWTFCLQTCSVPTPGVSPFLSCFPYLGFRSFCLTTQPHSPSWKARFHLLVLLVSPWVQGLTIFRLHFPKCVLRKLSLKHYSITKQEWEHYVFWPPSGKSQST